MSTTHHCTALLSCKCFSRVDRLGRSREPPSCVNWQTQTIASFIRAECGAPPVDWQNVEDSKAPEGWATAHLTSNIGNFKYCANGWNAYARMQTQGELYVTMEGYGYATVTYRDCWGDGFVGLYLNGNLIDKSPENNGNQRTYRYPWRLICTISYFFAD